MTRAPLVTLNDVRDAAAQIEGVAHRTPCWDRHALVEAGSDVGMIRVVMGVDDLAGPA